jgi:phosphoglycolate phosphatase-like HAD superfamily hydrolase
MAQIAAALLPGSQHIEIINHDIERGSVRHALFDFDGTISLIREGWQNVMIPMMVDILAEHARSGETREQLHEIVREFVTRLTGKQTIYQMIELADQIKARGGEPKEPLEYKWQYLHLLWDQIKDRVEGLKSGELRQEDFIVPGSYNLLRHLQARGVALYLASGTDRPYVLDEAGVLDLPQFFGDEMYGALDDYQSISKAKIIARIIETHGLSGPELVIFGDGYVEIENAKEVGGIAVGVATNERERRGVDDWKRNRLIEAGADVIIPDFREQDRVVGYLFNDASPPIPLSGP